MSELVGRSFGKWIVLERVRALIAGRMRNALACRCECGTERVIMPAALKAGQTTQCRDCGNREKAARKPRLTHGGAYTRLYSVWGNMRRRCADPDHADYPNYGGRGISVCTDWQDFSAFQAWAQASGYSHGLTIDRRNNDGNYEPGNCHWVSRTIQNRNRRDNQRFDWRGNQMMLSEIADETGAPHELLRQRVRRDGWDIERAIATPTQTYQPAGGQ